MMLIGIDASRATMPSGREQRIYTLYLARALLDLDRAIATGLYFNASPAADLFERSERVEWRVMPCTHLWTMRAWPGSVAASARCALCTRARGAADSPGSKRGHRARPGLSVLSGGAHLAFASLSRALDSLERLGGSARDRRFRGYPPRFDHFYGVDPAAFWWPICGRAGNGPCHRYTGPGGGSGALPHGVPVFSVCGHPSAAEKTW